MDAIVLLFILLILMTIVLPIFMIVFMISYWKIFRKAGREGWESLIPILNVYFLLIITGNEGWKLLLFFVPIVNIYMTIRINLDLAYSFGKDSSFGIGLIFLPVIFIPILAFSGAEYQNGIPDAPDTTKKESGEGFTTSNQTGGIVKRPQPKPEDPWVTGKE